MREKNYVTRDIIRIYSYFIKRYYPKYYCPFCNVTLFTIKAQKLQLKYRLLKASAANNCFILLANLSVEANTLGSDQTAQTDHTVCHRCFTHISADGENRFVL